MRIFNKRKGDLLSLLIIFLAAFFFFQNLFWPALRILVTPDFGRSDAWHFSFATKFFLSENLKQNKLPFWSSNLGGGFPVLAEGQTGVFFLPNLIFYKIFDPVIAYNLSLVLTLITLGWGTYLLLRMFALSKPVSLFGGLTLSFSGIAIAQMPHITLLQGFSIMPFILAGTFLLAQRKSYSAVIILSLLMSQQFLAGFPQASFITILFSVSFYLFLIWKSSDRIKDIIRLIVVLIFTFALSAVQFFPSLEFLNYSSLPGGFLPNQSTAFSFPFKHLLTFINPFYFGNPKLGTYPNFTVFHGSIFWENVGFLGILPIISFLFYFIVSKKNRSFFFFFASAFGSLLLMLGGYGPLYFIYSIWPFNLFRVPSRFIWVLMISLIILASFCLEQIYKRVAGLGQKSKCLFLIFLGLNLIWLIEIWKNYHNIEPAKNWLAAPFSKNWLGGKDRVFDLGSEISYNKFFLKNGWQNPEPYIFLRNLMAPDSNLLWHVSSGRVYAGRSLQRQEAIKELLDKELDLAENQATISALGEKILSLSSVNKVLTTLSLDSSTFVLKNSLSSKYGKIYDYENPKSAAPAYFAKKVTLIKTLEEADRVLRSDSFLAGQNVLLEKNIALDDFEGQPQVNLIRPSDTEVVINVSNVKTKSILVVNDTYYPGWKATVDSKEAEIMPANINFRAVIVPPGNHKIIFEYRPKSLIFGASLSGLAILFVIVSEAFLLLNGVFRTRRKASELQRHFSRSRGKSRLHKG